jgi:hypothetical protein
LVTRGFNGGGVDQKAGSYAASRLRFEAREYPRLAPWAAFFRRFAAFLARLEYPVNTFVGQN